MLQLLPTIFLFILFVFLFFREVRLDNKKYLDADRLGDEHVLKEIEKFIEEQRSKTTNKGVSATETVER